jgi:hypothetical protein
VVLDPGRYGMTVAEADRLRKRIAFSIAKLPQMIGYDMMFICNDKWFE